MLRSDGTQVSSPQSTCLSPESCPDPSWPLAGQIRVWATLPLHWSTQHHAHWAAGTSARQTATVAGIQTHNAGEMPQHTPLSQVLAKFCTGKDQTHKPVPAKGISVLLWLCVPCSWDRAVCVQPARLWPWAHTSHSECNMSSDWKYLALIFRGSLTERKSWG